jgi:hypothetical protein
MLIVPNAVVVWAAHFPRANANDLRLSAAHLLPHEDLLMTIESIPEDFPRGGTTASLSGAQPKLAVRRDVATGQYVAGLSDVELCERYDTCLDLVGQLVEKCRKNRMGKYVAMSESAILCGFFDKLKTSGWGTEHEMAWVIRHTASELGWRPVDEAEKLLHRLSN